MGVETMGRKRTGKGKPPGPETTKAFRMSTEYAEWVERFANFERTSVSSLLDRALAEHAKLRGFPVRQTACHKVRRFFRRYLQRRYSGNAQSSNLGLAGNRQAVVRYSPI